MRFKFREDRRRDVGKPAAIVVAEILEVKYDGDARGPGPAHQLQADRMPAVDQKHLRPESTQDLAGQVEEQARLVLAWCPLGPAVRCGQQRDSHAVELQVEDFCLAAAAEMTGKRPRRIEEFLTTESTDLHGIRTT